MEEEKSIIKRAWRADEWVTFPHAANNKTIKQIHSFLLRLASTLMPIRSDMARRECQQQERNATVLAKVNIGGAGSDGRCTETWNDRWKMRKTSINELASWAIFLFEHVAFRMTQRIHAADEMYLTLFISSVFCHVGPGGTTAKLTDIIISDFLTVSFWVGCGFRDDGSGGEKESGIRFPKFTCIQRCHNNRWFSNWFSAEMENGF